MTRFRRGRVSRGDEAAVVATSLVIGAGVAVASWYVLRLFLGREPLASTLPASHSERTTALPAGDSSSEPGG